MKDYNHVGVGNLVFKGNRGRLKIKEGSDRRINKTKREDQRHASIAIQLTEVIRNKNKKDG